MPPETAAHVITSYERNRSLFIPVTVELPKPVTLKALIDSGAMSSLIHTSVIRKYGIPTRKLRNPIIVRNVDGTRNANGSITKEAIVNLRYGKRSRKVRLLVANIGSEDLILGYGWLKKENPRINWETAEVDIKTLRDVEPEPRTKDAVIQLDTVKMVVGPKGTLPTRGTDGAIGYDLYSSEEVEIPARGWKAIDTDIKMEIPKGSYGRIAGRSGNALKHGLTTHGGVIDPDYRGNVKVIAFNMSAQTHRIIPGMRIAQIIFERAITPEIDQVDQLDQTGRGEQGFGSTDLVDQLDQTE